MNDIENNKGVMEIEELHKKGKEFLEALHESGFTPLGYKEMTEEQREWTNERIAKTLGLSPEEMKDEYANQIGWAKTGLYNQHIEKLEALKEGDFKRVQEIDKELKEFWKGVREEARKAVSLIEKLEDYYLKDQEKLLKDIQDRKQ